MIRNSFVDEITMKISWSHKSVRPILSTAFVVSFDQNLSDGLTALSLPRNSIMLAANRGRFTARILKYEIAISDDSVSPGGRIFITMKMITLDNNVRKLTSPDLWIA